MSETLTRKILKGSRHEAIGLVRAKWMWGRKEVMW